MTRGRVRSGLVAGLLVLAGTLLVVPAGLAAQAAAPATCVATPFRTNVDRHLVYRIPALVRTSRGTLLAFAERRRSTAPASDVSDTEIVLARSTDRGCHWSAPRVVADRGTDTVGNPAPVVDTVTGEVLLFSVDRPVGVTTLHGLHLQRSVDDGLSFTPYERAGQDLFGLPHWSGGLTGPGHAVQLHAATSPHPGRIVVPVGYYRDGRYGAYGIVSDDHGQHWSIGWNDQGDDQRIEGTVAELPDGRLWISYHDRDPGTPVGTGRIVDWSGDGGSSLNAPFRRAALPVVAVQGSSLALAGSYAGTLLFSSPARRDVATRHQMALFASRGAGVGATWSAPYDVQLDSRPGSYSDLVQVDDATVGVLYETGQTSWHERIDFRSLRIADIVDRMQVKSALSVAAPSPLRAGTTLRLTLRVQAPGTSSPAGELRVRLRGPGLDRAQTLPLYGDSAGRRVATLGTLRRGTYRIEVRYLGTSRIAAASTTKTITVR